MRRPGVAPVDPYHVASAIINGNANCECGQPAAYKGWFVNYSGSGKPITNAMLLCESCAKLCDEEIELKPLNDRPWEWKQE
jgi:hypothetical protein